MTLSHSGTRNETEVLLAGRKSLVVGQAVTWRQGSRLVRSTGILCHTAIWGFYRRLDKSMANGIGVQSEEKSMEKSSRS